MIIESSNDYRIVYKLKHRALYAIFSNFKNIKQRRQRKFHEMPLEDDARIRNALGIFFGKRR
jgi:hypothetical protein